jgi:hypothetical protein
MASSHNCSTINGFSLTLGGSFYYLPPSYKKTEFSIDYREGDTTELFIKTKKITHIDKINSLSTIKKLVFSDNAIRVSEFFDAGTANFTIDSGINFSTEWLPLEVSSGRIYDFVRGEYNLRLTVNGDLDSISKSLISCSREYGIESTCNRFSFSAKHGNGRNIDYTISVLNLC